MEIFKEIKGFENYEVSNYGNIRSLKRNIVLRPSIVNGYLHVGLYKDEKRYNKLVHRLVAEAFIPNPYNLPQVNHKDENKLNNFVWVNDDGSVDLEKSNLEWCTQKYNINYGTVKERIGKASAIYHKGKKLSEGAKRKLSERLMNRLDMSKPVVAVDSEGNVVYEFASTAEAGRNGFNQGHVAACCRGLIRTHGGYKWFFKSDWEKIKIPCSRAWD